MQIFQTILNHDVDGAIEKAIITLRDVDGRMVDVSMNGDVYRDDEKRVALLGAHIRFDVKVQQAAAEKAAELAALDAPKP